MRKSLGKIVAATAFILSSSSIVIADETKPSYLRIGVGYYDIFENDGDDQTATGHLEYISGEEYFNLTPFMGAMGTGQNAGYIYAGLRYDWRILENWIISPSFAPGLYSDGDGKDLGHTIQFRTAIEVSYEFEDKSRLGTSLYHLSNGSLGNANPGAEAVSLHYSYPLSD